MGNYSFSSGLPLFKIEVCIFFSDFFTPSWSKIPLKEWNKHHYFKEHLKDNSKCEELCFSLFYIKRAPFGLKFSQVSCNVYYDCDDINRTVPKTKGKLSLLAFTNGHEK